MSRLETGQAEKDAATSEPTTLLKKGRLVCAHHGVGRRHLTICVRCSLASEADDQGQVSMCIAVASRVLVIQTVVYRVRLGMLRNAYSKLHECNLVDIYGELRMSQYSRIEWPGSGLYPCIEVA